MKGLFLVFIFTFFSLENYSVVEEFHLLTTRQEEEKFILKYQGKSHPTVQAYVCAVEMKQVEYSFNPISKLKIFNKTKRKLDSLIDKNPENIDLRYVRLMLQEKTPSILGYKDNIEDDKKFLKREFELKIISKELQENIHKNTSL